MRVSLIGPGDIDYHYFQLLNIKKEQLDKTIGKIAKVLQETNNEIVLLPDKGISFEIAKKYKEMKGKKVIATIPKEDKDFGIAHLQSYLDSSIFDETIDTNNWYKQDATICLYGEVILMLGYSLGTMEELSLGFYLYKLFQGQRPELQIMKKKISPDIIAGNNIPFAVLIYKPFVKSKLNYEIEQYINKSGGKLVYIKNIKELKEKLIELQNKKI